MTALETEVAKRVVFDVMWDNSLGMPLLTATLADDPETQFQTYIDSPLHDLESAKSVCVAAMMSKTAGKN